MKNYIQNIELINQYINDELSNEDRIKFEKRIETDKEFKTLYEEQTEMVIGIKRYAIKKEIQKAYRSYKASKVFKYLGLSLFIGSLVAVAYFNFGFDDKNYLKQKLNFETELIQNYQVAFDSLITVVGKKGTIIRFNPNDLNHYSLGDSLTVSLIELTTKQELLLANVQTVSDGKWLISGGAFKIEIRSKGTPLTLKEDKTITVKFPKASKEPNMQLFYGKRGDDTNMNWTPSNIEFINEKQYVIFYKDTFVPDYRRARQFGVDMFKDSIIIDRLGYMDLNEIKVKFPKLDSIPIKEDTLSIYRKWVYSGPLESNYSIDDISSDEEIIFVSEVEILDSNIKDSLNIDNNIDELLGEDEPAYFWKNVIKIISREDAKKMEEERLNAISEIKASNSLNKSIDTFYKSIEISKLGWINIDKFVNNEETVKIYLIYTKETTFNETYIIDQLNNTVLNVYENTVYLPINRSFYIICIGIKGKTIYGYKKSVRFKTNSEHKIVFTKINETQIRSILKL